jgi:hypothetical protein
MKRIRANANEGKKNDIIYENQDVLNDENDSYDDDDNFSEDGKLRKTKSMKKSRTSNNKENKKSLKLGNTVIPVKTYNPIEQLKVDLEKPKEFDIFDGINDENTITDEEIDETNFSDEDKDDSVPASEAGQILLIVIENFMCHRKTRVDFCRNVNFVTGNNGSGITSHIII